MDKGPWTYGYSPTRECFYVESEDFKHDVRLYISGDFADGGEQSEYAEWLAAKLNGEVPK